MLVSSIRSVKFIFYFFFNDTATTDIYTNLTTLSLHAALPISSAARAPPLTGKRKVILVVFALTFLIMIYGVIPFDEMGLPIPALGWWFPELSALFLVGGVVIGLIDRMGEAEIAEQYVAGCADLLGVAFIIGISRGITVLMNDGCITDTVLNWGAKALTGAGSINIGRASCMERVLRLL